MNPPDRQRPHGDPTTHALRHAIAFTAALPIALLAHETGLEPVHAAAAAALLPGAHAAIDLVVHGSDLSFRQLGALTAFHCGAILVLAVTVTGILEMGTLE